MKRVIYCLLVVGLVFGSSLPYNPPDATAAPASKPLPKHMSYGTLPAPQANYRTAVGQSSILKKYAGLNVTVEPVGPAKAQMDLMKKKELELGQFDSYAVTLGYRGKGIFAKGGPQAIRLLMTGHYLGFACVTRPDRGIKSIRDLKGKKVHAIWPMAPALEVYSRAVLGAYGLTFDDMRALRYSSTAEYTQELIEGRIDAFFGNAKARATMEQIDGAAGAHIIPISHKPEVLNYIRKSLPMAHPYWFRSGYPGAKVDTPSVGIPMYLYSRADIDDEVVYIIVKTLLKHYDELKLLDPLLVEWTPKNAIMNAAIPFHPGAVKYYKEAGLWTKEMEEMQKNLLEGRK